MIESNYLILHPPLLYHMTKRMEDFFRMGQNSKPTLLLLNGCASISCYWTAMWAQKHHNATKSTSTQPTNFVFKGKEAMWEQQLSIDSTKNTSKSWLILSAVFADVSIKNIPFFSAYSIPSCKIQLYIFIQSNMKEFGSRIRNVTTTCKLCTAHLCGYFPTILKICFVTNQSHYYIRTPMLLQFLWDRYHQSFKVYTEFNRVGA